MPPDLSVISVGLLVLALVLATAIGGLIGRRIRAWRLGRGMGAGESPVAGAEVARGGLHPRPGLATGRSPRTHRRLVTVVGVLSGATAGLALLIALAAMPPAFSGGVLEATGAPDPGTSSSPATPTGAPSAAGSTIGPAGSGEVTLGSPVPTTPTSSGRPSAATPTRRPILRATDTPPPASTPGSTPVPTQPPAPTEPPSQPPTPGPTSSPTLPPTPTPTPVCEAPIATFSYVLSASSQKAPLTVSVTDSSTSLNCSITSWSWEWGDGTPPSAGTASSHTYTVTGTYIITLTVTNPAGSSTSDPVSIDVR